MHTSWMPQSLTVTAKNCPHDGAVNDSRQEMPLSPGSSRGQQTAPTVMSEEQRQFAACQHNLIYRFLYAQHWSLEEYYDIAAFGFLRAVMRYLREPQLRRYAFSTIAWRAMEQSISSHLRAEARRLSAEQRYCAEERSVNPDPFDEIEAVMLLQQLAPRQNEACYRLAMMRLQGYTIAETAKAQGMSPKRVRRILQEMYRNYLQLYQK